MEQRATHRPAKPDDFDFAWKLYSEAVRPKIEPLLKHPWTDEEQKRRFGTLWNPDKTTILMVGDKRVGWVAADEGGNEIVIENAYVAPEYSQQGIASQILTELLGRWDAMQKPIVVSVLKGAPHKQWLETLGFKHIDEQDLTFTLKRHAAK